MSPLLTPAPTGVVLRPLAGVRSVRQIDALTRPENAVRPSVQAVVQTLRRIAQQLLSGEVRQPRV